MQAAIRRIASEEPAPPRRKYALHARENIGVLRKGRPDYIANEIRGRPVHKGVPASEKADEWAKLAAEESDARGVGVYLLKPRRRQKRRDRDSPCLRMDLGWTTELPDTRWYGRTAKPGRASRPI